ncbi:MAG TPA: VCBS repeat-containing protein, partial [Planctomycetota bacterium]|nr:VCBS repeat-containing protein [Planctomycetota bacterium]
MQRSLRNAVVLAIALAPVQLAAAQVFVNTPGNLPAGAPFNSRDTEQIDFADIDLDGDLDALMADGSDCCQHQNRVWVNLAGLQGGTIGFFADETATRAPAVNDQSRDVELVDFDGDGDPDALMVNTSSLANSTGRWWTNQGGLQGGSYGFFADDTATRWVGLGGAGSSVPPWMVLPGGGFIAYGNDQDFADIDADGDLDLIAAAVGGGFSGQEPTRVFLNDGLGFFSEFNPSGAQSTLSMQEGIPALWAEGLQQHNTTDATGAFADVAVIATEMAVADVDGDLDLDLLLVDHMATPRMFRNRLNETGALGFRDVTGVTWPQGWGDGMGKYDAEYGDFDGDLDLDLYGLNWAAPFQDSTLQAVGDGTFGAPSIVAGTIGDDDAVELIDYDSDGDLDVFLPGWSGSDKLFDNVFAGADLAFAQVADPVAGVTGNLIGWEAETADLDQDGDFDLMRATEGPNRLLVNALNVPDTTAPSVTRLEQPADHASGTATMIRAHLYDNAPELELRRNATTLFYSLDNGPFVGSPMSFSGGQVFRGELPASAVGNVRYRVRSIDPQGNVGQSNLKAIDTSGGCSGQPATYCAAKLNTDGCVPRIEFEGAPKVGGTTSFVIRGLDVLAGQTGLLFYSKAGPGSAPFFGGTICIGNGILRTPGQVSGGAGACGGAYAFDFNAWIASG